MKIHVPPKRAGTVHISKGAVEPILKPPYLRCLRLRVGVSVHWSRVVRHMMREELARIHRPTMEMLGEEVHALREISQWIQNC